MRISRLGGSSERVSQYKGSSEGGGCDGSGLCMVGSKQSGGNNETPPRKKDMKYRSLRTISIADIT